MEYLRGSSFEGRGRALPCHAKTRELRQVTPQKAGGVMVEASEIDRLLQLRLRTGGFAGVDLFAFDEWDSYSREIGEKLYQYFRDPKLEEPLRAGTDINTIRRTGEFFEDLREFNAFKFIIPSYQGAGGEL